MAILVTGGAGYIGSHTCVELLNSGYEVVVMDNLYNASEKALERVEQITGKKLTFYKADMLDQEAMNAIFEKESIDSVIHFAGYKAVGESVQKPLEYYHNNITGTLILCDVMRNHGVKKIDFQLLRYCIRRSGICPDHRRMPEGQDYEPVRTDKGNAGADSDRSARIRSGVECRTASLLQSDRCAQERPHRRGSEGHPEQPGSVYRTGSCRQAEMLGVFGNDYDTPDGTGVRDYIHVVDLASGHVKAVQKLED